MPAGSRPLRHVGVQTLLAVACQGGTFFVPWLSELACGRCGLFPAGSACYAPTFRHSFRRLRPTSSERLPASWEHQDAFSSSGSEEICSSGGGPVVCVRERESVTDVRHSHEAAEAS